MVRLFWGAVAIPAAHILIGARLVVWLTGAELGVEMVTDTEVAYLCRMVYRSPECPVHSNRPETCPVYVGD